MTAAYADTQAPKRDVPGLEIVRGKKDPETTKDLDRLFKLAKEDRQPLERQWMINLAFVYDQQWVFWNEVDQRLQRPRAPKYRVLAVINLIKGVVRTEYAKLSQKRPTAKTQPASGDTDDRDQAKVCDAILEYLDATDGSEGASKRALLWGIITGTGILHGYWNKAKGDVLTYPANTMVEVVDPTTQQPVQQEVPHPQANQPVVDQQGDEVHSGDEETCEISPLEFYPDPYGLTIDDKDWAFVVKLRSSEWVMDRYGVEVQPHDVPSDNYVEGQMAVLAGETATTRKGVVVKDFTQRPNKKYPQGRYVVYVDDVILWSGPNQSKSRIAQLPFSSFVHIPVPGRFWGDSMVTSLIDPQKNLNKSRSQAVEHRNLMTKGKWLVAKTALDVGKTITSAPGEIIEYNPVAGVTKPIEHISGSEIPDSYWKDITESKQEIRDVSGVNEVSNAQTPGGVTAARAIERLQEQDDLRLGPTSQAYEDAIAHHAKIRLAIVRENCDEPRVIRITGKNNVSRVVEFMKDDIPEEVDVHVEAGSALPKSRVARQNFVMNLWKEKMIPDLRVALRMLELGEVEGLYEAVNADIDQAERENEKLKQGQPAQVRDFHSHDIHVSEHNRMRKSEEYEHLDPQYVAIIDQHVAEHQAALITQQAAMAPTGPNGMVARAGAPTDGAVGDTGQLPDLTQQPAAV